MLTYYKNIKKHKKGNILLGTLITMIMVFTVSGFTINILKKRVDTNSLINKTVFRENNKIKEILLTKLNSQLQSYLDQYISENHEEEISEIELLKSFKTIITYENCSIKYDNIRACINLHVKDFSGSYSNESYKCKINENKVKLIRYEGEVHYEFK
ncbi:hypothetical protein [Clostridium algidicarnis]|uniref:hypothetical protein n=1 Tax=Clostridium algidicarnis TaxID=37659 RepID=UPI001C0C1E71|nr:hypothetical protein [Clostridium algidicarnis]MBU3195476.1 hypothetical protein [Clostridium algidicarnis]MBU3208436.1 hypothetical protein [Clostridium algidicarnis]MBU3226968.1 hypothetical protein [Clostridium algidicarnis]MBU3250121.1 hypothetical protein [Clostridium algidicarnis]